MKPAISIDLGAAFTKVAFRKEADSSSILLNHEKLRLDEGHVCIPSIAAWRESDDRWVFGVDAADIQPGEGVHVFRNWKPMLFNPTAEVLDPDSALGRVFHRVLPMGEHGDHRLQVRTVAVKFFEWLREVMLPELLGGAPVEDPVVRICIPDFALETAEADEVERILTDAGWETPWSFCISEPLANLTGALSQGKNSVEQDGQGMLVPNIEDIFSGSELLKFVDSTSVAVPESEDGFTVLLVDIGAYTADSGVVAIDPDSIGYFPLCETHSEPYGIEMLDDLVKDALSEEKSEIITKLTATEREQFRRTVYSEERSWSINNVTFGDGEEAQVIDRCITELTGKISEEIDAFLESHEVSKLSEVVFTGGGSNIPRIVQRLAEKLVDKGVGTYHSAKLTGAPGGSKTVEVSQQVVRGSSALGGASVLFGDV